MWRINDKGLTWRSVVLTAAVFLPAAYLIGFIPGWWWWIAAAALFLMMGLTINVLAKRDRRRFAKPS